MAVILPNNDHKLSSAPMPENKEVEKASSDPMAIAIDKAKPIIAKISFGSIIGYCSGYTLKQVGKVAAIILGAGFIAVQTCVSYGYIQVDWNKVKDDALKKVDTVSVQDSTAYPMLLIPRLSLPFFTGRNAM
jgi:uncharacterized membrane protein (Fun14 family)